MPTSSRGWVVGSIVCAALLTAVDAGAQASRKVRVDIGDGSFEFFGGVWDDPENVVDLSGDQQVRVTLPFDIDFGLGAHRYDAGFGENGFLSLVPTGAPLPGVGTPAGDFVAARAADLYGTQPASTRWGTGAVDTFGTPPFSDPPGIPYSLDRAVPAIRFSWVDMCLSGFVCEGQAPSTSSQIVFLDRGNGDFDLELNYNESTTAYGLRGLSLGANVVPLENGGFVGGLPDYCFRGGKAFACSDATGVVPEPATALLMAFGLAGVAVGALQRSQRRRGATGAVAAG